MQIDHAGDHEHRDGPPTESSEAPPEFVEQSLPKWGGSIERKTGTPTTPRKNMPPSQSIAASTCSVTLA
jgi:hypothetical protein